MNERCGDEDISNPILPDKEVFAGRKIERCWQRTRASHHETQETNQEATESDFDRFQELHLDRPFAISSLVIELK
jgi:hypothetical protein